jgi:hypothetical protein
MTITESDLRELLDLDSADVPHAAVTAADVHRRIRRIRRRRLSVLAGVAGAALVAAGVNALPRTVTPEVPDDIWAGVMAQPTPSNPSAFYYPDEVVARERQVRAGVRKQFGYPAVRKPVMIGVTCADPDSYAIVWVHGMILTSGSCGPKAKPFEFGMLDGSGTLLSKGLDVEVLVVPIEKVSHPQTIVSVTQADHLTKTVKPYRADWNLVITVIRPGS